MTTCVDPEIRSPDAIIPQRFSAKTLVGTWSILAQLDSLVIRPVLSLLYPPTKRMHASWPETEGWDPQVAFLKLFIERLQCPPLYSKLVNRRGTFFQQADHRRPPILGIPKLIKQYAPLPCQPGIHKPSFHPSIASLPLDPSGRACP